MQAGLKALGITALTPVQAQAVPLLLAQKSVIAASPPGTGKTLAFLLPVMESVNLDDRRVQAIVVSPTRELGAQICGVVSTFAAFEPRLTTAFLGGGQSAERQAEKLRASPPLVLVATPGRLLALMRSGAGSGFLSGLRYVVYDEADMFADDSFAAEHAALRARLGKNASFVQAAFGATLHQALRDRFRRLIPGAVSVACGDHKAGRPALKHYAVSGAGGDRFAQLLALTKKMSPYMCLVFAPDKRTADEIASRLTAAGVSCAKLHGGLTAPERKRAHAAIAKRQRQYAVVSDLAARGIDVAGVSHAVSWGLPRDAAWYAHRAGRCGRAGHEGASYVLLDADEARQAPKNLPPGVAWRFLRVSPAGELQSATAAGAGKAAKRPPLDAATALALRRAALENKSKKTQPNCRKRVREAKRKILQKAKRAAIDAKVKATLRRRAKRGDGR